MHERESAQQVERVPSRLDRKSPMSRRRSDNANQTFVTANDTGQMLSPKKRSVERPDLSINRLQTVPFANNGPNRRDPDGDPIPAEYEPHPSHDSFRTDQALLAPVRIEESGRSGAWQQMQDRYSWSLVAHFFVSAGTENSNAIGRRSLNTGVIPTITAIQPFWGFQIAQGCLSVPHRKSQCGPPSRFSAAQLVTNGGLCRLANVGGSGRVRRCRSPYGCKLSTLAFGKLRASKRSE